MVELPGGGLRGLKGDKSKGGKGDKVKRTVEEAAATSPRLFAGTAKEKDSQEECRQRKS